jgi:hypothetical protein
MPEHLFSVVRNRWAFSDHWLEHRLELEPEWTEVQNESVQVLNELVELWKLEKTRVEKYKNEQSLEVGFIQPVMKALGLKLKYQTFLQGREALPDGREEDEAFTYFDHISTVRGDSTGLGDFPMEYLQDHAGLPVGDESKVKFTAQSKNEMYTLWEAALFKDGGDPARFSFWAEDPLAAELIDQSTRLIREYKTDAELLSPHAPEEPGCYDDACTMAALGSLGAATGMVGEIVIL